MKHQDSEEQLAGLGDHGGASPAQFPLRLHDVLDASEKEGFQHVVSWLPEGNGFQIHDADNMLPILQKYGFNQSRWKSFLRQLQNYGFRREIRGPTKGKCTHELFVKGRRELCHNMRRKLRKSNSAENFQKTNQNSKKSRGGLTAQAIALSQEQMYARAALSAPALGRLARGGSGSVSSSFARLNLATPRNSNATKNGNASFNFVPSASSMSSKSSLPLSSKTGLLSTTGRSRTNRKSLLANGADQLIWDIQKELSKDGSMKKPTGDMEPLDYIGPANLPLIVDGMNETEVNETMCSIFLTEPSLEETYDISM